MKILIVTYGSIHARIAVRMAREYIKNKIDYTILAMPAAIAVLKESGLPFSTIKSYIQNSEYATTAYQIGSELARSAHNDSMDFAFEDTAYYYGVSMCDLIASYGEKKAFTLFNKLDRKAFLPISFMKHVLSIERPDIVQTSCDVRMEKAATLAAKELSIESFIIIDSFYVLFAEFDGNAVMLPNDYLYKKAVKLPYNKNKLYVTGHPCFEKYSQIDHLHNKTTFCSTFQLDLDLPIISWYGHETDEYVLTLFYKLCELADSMPTVNFIVKLHPTAQHLNEYPLKKEYKNLRIIKNYKSEVIISASAAVITGFSTVGFEAILLEKPVIVVNETNQAYPIQYEEEGAAIYVDDLNDLEHTISDVLYDPLVEKRLHQARSLYISSPNAAQNIIDVINDLLSKPS